MLMIPGHSLSLGALTLEGVACKCKLPASATSAIEGTGLCAAINGLGLKTYALLLEPGSYALHLDLPEAANSCKRKGCCKASLSWQG